MSKFQKYKDLLFSTLAEITSLIIADNDKRLIFRKVLDCCLTVLDVERIYLLEIQGNHIIRYSKSKDSDPEGGIRIESLEESHAIRDWMIREDTTSSSFEHGRELAFDMPNLADKYLDTGESKGLIMSAPLVAKKSMFGLLVAIHPAVGGLYTADDVKLFTVLANQAAIALENRQLYQKLEKEAITDALTSVYNYRFLMDSLRTEIKRALRFKQIFSFVMLDVDNLKQYNDRLGHLWGSQALKEIASIIVDKCREIDLVSKYGGDEFGILLPQTDARGAEEVTRRVIEAVAEHKFDGDTGGLLTCSAGVAMFPRDGGTVRELIASADKALYQAKRMGKNQVLTTRGVVTEVKK
jgi:diguanylate cyclase (GGDEF)-like protein